MRPTSTGDECEMNIQPPKAIRFYRAPPAEKNTTEKSTSIRRNPELDKERETVAREPKTFYFTCRFFLIATDFLRLKEMQFREFGVTTIEVIKVDLTFHSI